MIVQASFHQKAAAGFVEQPAQVVPARALCPRRLLRAAGFQVYAMAVEIGDAFELAWLGQLVLAGV
jgi:hypothetical protein